MATGWEDDAVRHGAVLSCEVEGVGVGEAVKAGEMVRQLNRRMIYPRW